MIFSQTSPKDPTSLVFGVLLKPVPTLLTLARIGMKLSLQSSEHGYGDKLMQDVRFKTYTNSVFVLLGLNVGLN